jgi:hypothetical protein
VPSIDEQVATMGALIHEGKVKYWGLANETTFGEFSVQGSVCLNVVSPDSCDFVFESVWCCLDNA